MKPSNSIFLIITAAFGLLCPGCKKNHERLDQWSFSKNALNYVKLDLGKYLIYKDSATSLEDSVIVTKSDLYSIYGAGWGNYFSYPNHNYESYDLQLTKFNGSSQSLWLDAKADANKGYYHSIDTVYVMLIDQADHFMIFYGAESSQPNLSMTVEGETYNNVVETISINGDSTGPGYRKSICYWAKPMGIIKRTIIVGSAIKTYTLLRNN